MHRDQPIHIQRPLAWPIRVLLWVGCAAFVALVLVIATFAVYRLRGPSAAQRVALVLMQQDRRPVEGENAFAQLWFLGHDVTDDQLGARMAADIKAVNDLLRAGESATQYVPSAPALPSPRKGEKGLCWMRMRGCLAHVESDPSRTRAALSKYAQITRKARGLERTDMWWSDFPADYEAPVGVSTVVQPLWLSELALQYADGDRAAAIAGTCRNIDSWRRLRQSTNSLITDMLAIAFAEDAMQLLADMWALQSMDESVPADCVTALRSIERPDVDRCSAVAGEFAMVMAAYARIAPVDAEHPDPSWVRRGLYWLIFDRTQAAARHAERLAFYCEDVTSELLLTDTLPEPPGLATNRIDPGCVSDVVGCYMMEISSPLGFTEYDRRVLDYAAHLRLAATLLWLRTDPEVGAWSSLFVRRPEALRSNGHVSGIDAERGRLYVDNLHAERSARFSLAAPRAGSKPKP